MTSPSFESLTIRKVADTTVGERVTRYLPDTGDAYLVNPATGQPEPWPLRGIALGEVPLHSRISQNMVKRGQAEGWLELVGSQLVHRSGGPPEDPWRVTHTFFHAEEIVIKTMEGEEDVRFEVTRQPDKFAAREIEEINSDKGLFRRVIEPEKLVTPEIYAAAETDVAWYYNLKALNGIAKKGSPVQAVDFVFNRAKGRGTQWVEEIRASVSPYANSALIISLWRRGSATDAALKDYDDVTALEGDAQAAELVSGTNANYGRKTIIDTTPTITYDDTNEWVDIDFPDQTWVALGAGGTAITDLLTAFDNDTTAGTDANQIPWMFSAFAVTADGSDVTAVLPTGGLFRAS